MLTLPAWLYIPFAMMFLSGIALIRWAAFSDRSRGRNRCPRCWYDMSGTIGLRCSECGHECSELRQLHRTRRRWPLAFLGALLSVPAIGYFMYRDGKRAWYALPPKYKTTQVVRTDGIVVKALARRDPSERSGRLSLTFDGKTIFESEDYMTGLGLPMWDPESLAESPKIIGAGDDFNGDGTLEVVLTQYSGGAHCCYFVTLVELTRPPRIVASIDAMNGMSVLRLPSGEIVLNVPDQSFDYWNAPHVSSPFPNVYYRLVNHRLEVAMDLMLAQQTKPGIEELAAESDAIRTSIIKDAAALDSKMWRIMLDLLYNGRESEAWTFFDASWPESVPGKAEFKAEFVKILETGTAWRHFKPALEAYRMGRSLPEAKFDAKFETEIGE